ASDLALLGRVSLYTDPEAVTFDASMSPADVAVDPEGRYIYYAGFAWSCGQPDMATYGGEQLVVASHDDYEMIDLDQDESNGLTCIRLPASPGGSSGTYSAHVMKISPDGDRLYMAAGSSGVLVVEFTHGGSGVWSVRPSRGGDDDVTITVTGGGFAAGTTMSLERTGFPTIRASRTFVVGATTLKAVFDLTGRAHGAYDVVLTTPDDSQTRLAGAFVIEAARESASLEIIGEATLFSSGASSVHVVCHNTGNIDLLNPVISVQLTAGTQYRVELPATVPGGLTQLDDEFSEAVASHPEYVWVSRIGAQDSYSFWLHVAGPENVAPLHWDVNLEATIGYLQSATDSSSAKLATRFSPIGDACTIFDAAATNIHREFAERGYEVEFEEVFDIIEDAFVQSAADYGVSKLEEVVARGLGQMVVLAVIPEAAPIYLIMFDGINDLRSCYLMYRTYLGFNALFAWDPNDKVSHTGVNGCIYGNETLRYIIHFENLPEATAAATDVVITDTLDENLDYSTFTLVGSSHSSVLTTNLSTETGVVTFTFRNINLPPNDTPPEGEGWVEYTIRPVADLASGTQIRNQASIVFDRNDPIVTPEVVHTIDRTAPTSSVAALPARTSGDTIALQWSGSDAGAGVMDYTVYVSVDGGAYSAWLSETTSTTATYEGAIGHRYGFYTIARDGLGNTESAPGQPDATTTLVARGRGGCGAMGPGGLVILAAGVLGLGFIRARVLCRRRWRRRSRSGP
ncbi:MAG TPA: isopeptide-forming domain-containing fimbrial protein, partial [Phycisphaerae bacterium]|nr:isopeptide-forming domain-containing fimbrial protein [Phycisphaerae bacterium]